MWVAAAAMLAYGHSPMTAAHSRLRVWCTTAERMDLVRDGRRVPLRREGQHFHCDQALAHGDDYALSLGGGEPLPDPRSAWQPHGVHGPSRYVDHGRFAWEGDDFTPLPLADAVIYELHIGTFSPEGDFDGAVEKLDPLVALGVTHVELLPVAAFPGERGWGYDGVAIFAPHHGYGGPDGMKRFVDACHRRGLAVILDVVYNHLGPEGNYLARFAPYLSWRHRTPWGESFNFDEQDAAEVRRFICDNATSWIRDYHVDGLRLDATHSLFDTSAIHILEELTIAVARAGEQRGVTPVLIAEALTNDPWVTRSRAQNGLGLDAQWSDDFHHALHGALVGERHGGLVDFAGLAPLARCLTHGWYLDGKHSQFRGRPHGRLLDDARGGHGLVSYSQNHDQVGNRAHGERLHHLAGIERAKIAAALTLLGPGVPMLFMGQEWGTSSPFLFFCDFGDPRLARDVERGRARELAAHGFDDAPSPGDEDTFARSVLDWSERDTATASDMLAWHRALIALRRSEPSLRDGDLSRCQVRHGEDWLVLSRGPVTVGVSLAEGVSLPVTGGEVVLASHPHISPLPPNAVVVWRDALGVSA